eukprot:TRINITY_DN1203_c0_g1_i1.p1 TRINITY_DN1203_c0_g1~~TRINITY_DN1203_c0_g1_i1.p1  ORF type:complete len:112 (-),score=15.31 TRINITY_DN1203_c0_g1_i1:654-989(-)
MMDLLDAAKKFEVPLLEHKCEVFAKRKIPFSNACGLIIEARRIGREELEGYFRGFILHNSESFFTVENIIYLSDEHLLFLVKDNELFGNVKEIEVFNLCVEWAKQRCGEQK